MVKKTVLIILFLVLSIISGCSQSNQTNAYQENEVYSEENLETNQMYLDAKKEYETLASNINYNEIVYESYENDKVGIKLNYPNTWIVDEESAQIMGGVAMITSPLEFEGDNLQESAILFVFNNSQDLVLDEFITKFKSDILSNLLSKNTEFILEEDIKISNLESKSLIYVTDLKFNKYKYRTIITLKDDKIYELLLTSRDYSYDNYQPIFEKMIESYEIES